MLQNLSSHNFTETLQLLPTHQLIRHSVGNQTLLEHNSFQSYFLQNM